MTKKYELVDAGCNFWFNDNDRMRSPFPRSIQPELKERATQELVRWVRDFSKEDRETIEDEEMISMFEMFLFSEALKLVENEPDNLDLMMTINYPMLPRLGDTMSDEAHAESTIVRRTLREEQVENEKKKKVFVVLHLKNEASDKEWMTEAELPT